jgi:hypothetical protein
MRLFSSAKKEETLAAGSSYHITRGIWSYINNPVFITRVKSLGWRFQGTLNGCTTNPDFALPDRDGRPLPFVHSETIFWANPANKGYREEYLKTARQWIDNGAESLQRDDAEFGEWNWRGKREPIPAEELHAFHAWGRREIEAHAGRKITMSTNVAKDPPFMKCFDYRITERRFTHIRPSIMLEDARKARQQKMIMVITGQEDRPVADYRRAWAGAYATGNLYVIPWDQFNVDSVLNNPQAARICVPPSELADLTGFVRAIGPYLDGYEDAAVAGHDVRENRYAEAPLTIEGGSGQLTAFVRARPGEIEAPVVVHLVEWAEQAQPAKLLLRNDLFFGGRGLKVSILEPVPYDKELHEEAAAKALKMLGPEERLSSRQSPAYASLARETQAKVVPRGALTEVEIPRLSPWALLVVAPGDP